MSHTHTSETTSSSGFIAINWQEFTECLPCVGEFRKSRKHKERHTKGSRILCHFRLSENKCPRRLAKELSGTGVLAAIQALSVQLDSSPWLLSQSTALGTSPHEHSSWLDYSGARSTCTAEHQESEKKKVSLF